MIVPDKEQFLRQAEVGTLVPVFREYHADLETPVSAYLKISARFPTDHFLLESVEGGEKWARYSFIGFDPHLRFRADAKGITVRQGGETRNVPVAGDPLDALAGILKEIRYRPAPGLPRLSGGAVGYIGYDYVRYLEKVGGNRPLTGAPDAMFLFPSRLVIFDNVRHTILIVAHGSVRAGEDPGAAYARALEAIEEVRGILRVPLEGTEVPDGDDGGEPPAFEMARETFLDAVRKAKEHIRNGDIIQAVLSNRATVRTRRTPAEVYRVLRALNPSPYMYLLRMGDLSVVGSSPEILVRLEGDEIQLRPIAGTRPRGATPSEDRRLEAELLSDPKELAEHVMLVDLGRNDVGRVAAWGIRESRRTDGDRAVLARHAHRVERGREASRGAHRVRRAPRGVSRGDGLGRPEGPGDADHLRARAVPPRDLRGGGGVFRPAGKHGLLHRHPDHRDVGGGGHDPGRGGDRGGFGPGAGMGRDPEQGEDPVPRRRRFAGSAGGAMIAVIDNYDSFTWNLVQYICELGAEVEVFRNDAITVKELALRNPAGLVISPGPGGPDEAGISLDAIRAFEDRIPILGVCLGHQCIGQAFGGRVVHAQALMHGKTSRVRHNGKGIFSMVENPMTATRYHSLAVERGTLPTGA